MTHRWPYLVFIPTDEGWFYVGGTNVRKFLRKFLAEWPECVVIVFDENGSPIRLIRSAEEV